MIMHLKFTDEEMQEVYRISENYTECRKAIATPRNADMGRWAFRI